MLSKSFISLRPSAPSRSLRYHLNAVTGRFDLILVVLLKSGFGLLEFYTDEVSKLKDVQSVETFVVYKSYNLKLPYIIE